MKYLLLVFLHYAGFCILECFSYGILQTKSKLGNESVGMANPPFPEEIERVLKNGNEIFTITHKKIGHSESLQNELDEFCKAHPENAHYRRLRREILSVPVPEQILATVLDLNDRMFEIVLKYATPAALNEILLSYGGETLLTFLSRKGPSLQYVKYFIALFEAGANLNVVNTDMETPFFVAVNSKNTVIVQFILRQLFYHSNIPKELLVKYILSTSNSGKSALCAAMETEQFDIASILLEVAGPLSTTQFTFKCSSLLNTISHGGLTLIDKLIQLEYRVSKKSEIVHTSLNFAIKTRRMAVIEELVKTAAELAHFEHPHKIVFPLKGGESNRIQRIFEAMIHQYDETIVLSLVEIEIHARNRAICSELNLDGRTLLFETIRYGYHQATEALIWFYRFMIKNKLFGFEYCYGDAPDKLGRCASAALIASEKWINVKSQKLVLQFLFSSRHPITGENCLHNALSDKQNTETVFRFVGNEAVKRFGPDILDLATRDRSGGDLLFRGVELQSDEVVMSLLLGWLADGSKTNVLYEVSLIKGLFAAGGGASYGGKRLKERTPYPNALRVAATVCPIALQHILLTKIIITPTDEQAYRNILNTYPGRFPRTEKSPLSQVVKSLLWPLNMINDASLVEELAGPHNRFRYIEEHFTYALYEAGSSRSLPLLYYNRTLKEFTSLLKIVLTRPLLPWKFRPIFGDERITELRVAQKTPLSPYASYFPMKRAKIIVALLESPLGQPHNVLQIITLSVLVLSLIIFLCHATILWYCFYSKKNFNTTILMFVTDIIPEAKKTWCLAVIEGCRRCIIMPNNISILLQSPSDKKHDVSTISYNNSLGFQHICFCFKLFYHICFIWYIVESVIICQLYENNQNGYGLLLKYKPPLCYAIPVTIIMHTLLAKLTCKEQAIWIEWMLFGLRPSQYKSSSCSFSKSSDITSLSPRFYWLPGSQRIATAYIRSLQRLQVKSTGTVPLRFNPAFRAFAKKACAFHKKRLFNWYSNSDTEVTQKTTRRQFNSPSVDCLGEKYLPWSSPNDPLKLPQLRCNKKKSGCKTATVGCQRNYLAEKRLLHAGLREFGLSRETGFSTDILILNLLCFLAVQFPYWRYFKPFQLLYFDVYNSYTKFDTYYNDPLIITIFRELAILIASWQHLVQMGMPILLALRLSNVMGRSATGVKNFFPLKSACRYLLSPPPLDKNKWWNTATLKAYVDVRQTIFKQFEYIWFPTKNALNFFFLYWGVCLVVYLPMLTRGAVTKLFFSPQYNQLATQFFVCSFLINWLSFRAAKANNAAASGWLNLRNLYTLPPSDNMDRVSKRIVFQAIKFFQMHEFQFTLAGVQLNKKFAFAFCIFSFVLLFEATVRDRGK